MFKVTATPTGIKVTAAATGSTVAVKHTAEGYTREKVMATETEFLEDSKEIANAGYLALAIQKLLPLIGGKKMAVADKIKVMAEALKGMSTVGTYRTLNNKLRQHFDDGTLMTADDYHAELFYEGAWRYPNRKKVKAVATKPAAKKATVPAAAKPKKAAKKATVAAAPPAVAKATKKASGTKPKAKKVTPAPIAVVDAPVALEVLADEAENLILQDAPETVLDAVEA